MKNTLMATVAALFFAGSATAAELGGSVGVEVTENAAGDFVAETTLGFGVTAETGVGVAFGGFAFESVDGGDLEVDEWQIGLSFGETTVSLGQQDDVFVEGRMEIVGEDTLALPEDSEVESVIVQHGAFAGFVGFEDLSSDISEVRNVQLSYTLEVNDFDVTGAVDYNDVTEETTLGVAGDYAVNELVAVGGVFTYTTDAEVFGYEAYASYSDFTGFVNGDDSDMLQNVGLGWNRDFDNLNVYVEAAYNLDDEAETIGAGVAFKF